jgi:hypothetical protein
MSHETDAQKRKIHKVLDEYKGGTLKSGHGGGPVKNRKQAIAIALSEAGVSKRRSGKRK